MTLLQEPFTAENAERAEFKKCKIGKKEDLFLRARQKIRRSLRTLR